jgi:hypothetical protein
MTARASTVAVFAMLVLAWPMAACPQASAPQRLGQRLTTLEPFRERSVVIVRSTETGGPLELVTFDATTRRVTGRMPIGLACERLHTGGAVIACLRYQLATRAALVQLDLHDWTLHLTQRNAVQAHSLISRLRVSIDGRFVGITVFVSGHSYAAPGQFSTLTQIWDAREGRLAASSETLQLMHQGQPVADTPQTRLNFWGVTFDPRDGDRFFVTVSIRGQPWLARGSISRGVVQTLRADVECPSISPDGTRIAFKMRRADGRHWDPAVLDLATGQEVVLPAAKGVDDQIEWLDNDALLYEATETRMGGAKTDLMLRRLGQPDVGEQLWLPDAASPAVHRGTSPPLLAPAPSEKR